MARTKEQTLALYGKKPPFGSLYRVKGSRYIYISMNYFHRRLRFPTDYEATPENWAELWDLMAGVGEAIKKGTFSFAKTFPWLDEELKKKFTELEGSEYYPEPEHVTFGAYADKYMQKRASHFTATKRTDYRRDIRTLKTYFQDTVFAKITTEALEDFIDAYTHERALAGTPFLSSKRVKNLLIPMRKIWVAACGAHNWNLRNPFAGLDEKLKQMDDETLQNRERVLLEDPDAEPDEPVRDVFLLAEWRKLQEEIDQHYHVVMELLLCGMIGSELEGLLKRNIKEDEIWVRHKIIHESVTEEERIEGKVVKVREEKVHFGLKLKNWFRKRQIPMTAKLKALLEEAMRRSTSKDIRCFEKGIKLSAGEFVLTMKDGSPFAYDKFYNHVWIPAFAKTGIPYKVPYASRHTLVQWALLLGITKTRLVEIMGHCNKEMIDKVYGNYRKGLIDEKEEILDYLGEDFLAVEELKVAFPERYRALMLNRQLTTEKAPGIASAFGQSFGQSQELYPDNYPKS